MNEFHELKIFFEFKSYSQYFFTKIWNVEIIMKYEKSFSADDAHLYFCFCFVDIYVWKEIEKRLSRQNFMYKKYLVKCYCRMFYVWKKQTFCSFIIVQLIVFSKNVLHAVISFWKTGFFIFFFLSDMIQVCQGKSWICNKNQILSICDKFKNIEIYWFLFHSRYVCKKKQLVLLFMHHTPLIINWEERKIAIPNFYILLSFKLNVTRNWDLIPRNCRNG